MKKLISVLCIVLMLFSICGCVKKLKDTQPDGEIVSNGGIAVKQGEWIYFINGAMPETVDNALMNTPVSKIYRMKADGSQLQPITKKKAQNMYVYKDKIFYVTPTQTQVALYCIGIDATKNKKLLTFNSGDFIVYGEKGLAVGTDEKIHYFDYETLKKQSFDTGNVDGIRLSDSYIYCFAETVVGTKRIEISTGNTETICDETGLLLWASDSEVFFVSARIPFKVNTNTMEKTQISETYYQTTLINMTHRVIICVESDENNQGIYTQPIDNVAGRPVEEGGNVARTKVHSKNAVALCANDDYIFFVEEGTGDIYRMTFEGTEKTVLGKMESIYRADTMDVVDNLLFIFDSAESGKMYYVPADGSGQLTVIKEQ